MASKLLEQSVTKNDEGTTWDFQCPGVRNSRCGGDGVPFTSAGWPTRKAAIARGAEHFAEHKGEGTTSELAEFRTAQGLGVDDAGTTVSLEEL